MAKSKSPGQRGYDQNDKSMSDLQAMIDSVRLDGKITSAKVDELASAIHQKLGLTHVDNQLFRDFATNMAKMSISRKECNDTNVDSDPLSPSDPSSLKGATHDKPTWSQESPNPEAPPLNTITASPVRPRQDVPSGATRSPAPVNMEGSNRGRSPTRPRGPNLPRSGRSRTPVSLFRRNRTADGGISPHATESPRERTPSPFGRLVGRGNKQEAPPAESPAPSVYYEAHMNEDSVLHHSPSPDRRSRRPEPSPTEGRPPLASVNVDTSSSFLSPPTGIPTHDTGATMPTPFRPSPDVTTADTPTTTMGPTYTPQQPLSLDDIKFCIGTSPVPVASPSLRSPHHRSRAARTTNARATSNSPSTLGSINDDEMLHSPSEDAKTQSKLEKKWEDTPSSRGRTKSRFNPRSFGSKNKNKSRSRNTPASDENTRQRSRSPFARFFGRSPRNMAVETPREDTANVQNAAATFETSPIPPFQAPAQFFSNSTSSMDRRSTDAFQTAGPSAANADTVAATRMSHRMTAPPTMGESAAAASVGMMSPKTPMVANQTGFSEAPYSVATSVNKKGRNTATPILVEPSVPLVSDSDIHFEVDLSKDKSSKSKFRGKRGGGLRRGGASRTNDSSSFQSLLPASFSECSASPSASETSAHPKDDMQHKSPRQDFQQTSPGKAQGFNFSETTPKNQTTGNPQTLFSPKLSPMDIDNDATQSEQTLRNPPVDDSAVQFNLGIGGKASAAGKSRVPFCKKGARASVARVQQQRNQSDRSGVQSAEDISTEYSRSNCEHSMNQATSGEANVGQSYNTQTVNPQSDIDYSGRRAMVMSLREDGRSLYLSGDYRSSILRYTTAIQAFTNDCMNDPAKDLLAVLLSNRAAGLVMIGAFKTAAEDCQRALQYVSDPATYVTSSDSGPVLQSKLFTRMARAFLKLGEADAAERAFDQAIETTIRSLTLCSQLQDKAKFELAKRGLGQIATEASLGKTEVSRFRDALEKIAALSRQATHAPKLSERKSNLEALGQVNIAIFTATGCTFLHEKKVSLLASLKQWREVASQCERLAAANAKFDGIFTEDLAAKHPFTGVPHAKNLSADFFGDSKEDELQGAEMKLNSKAAAEAVLRIPYSMTSYYVRALRLEERYPAAESALKSLEILVRERAAVHDQERLRARFAWLPREHDKLSRTKNGRERGDELFRNGDFDRAAAQYAACLTIDSEGCTDGFDGSSAGGRLHAVLHCNRAACLMALRRFHEALNECTAALRIHSRYMKAMLRRGRCYSRLERYEETIAEYKRWLEMAREARKTPHNIAAVLTPCLFDGPHDMSEADIAQVKQELEEVSKTKAKNDAAARAEANYREQRQNKWQKDAQNASTDQGDAQRRRDYFYSQKTNSRRWDSFTDRGPKRSTKTNAKSAYGAEQSKPRSKTLPKNSSNPDCHYNVLEIKNGATESEIKKAYRKMALKYHPDKNSDPGAVELFRRVSQAYVVLNDSTTRRKYDSETRRNRRF
jgi:tetratricopeptide (TPR) repeat protein